MLRGILIISILRGVLIIFLIPIWEKEKGLKLIIQVSTLKGRKRNAS